jgi:hypothetical protein
MEPVSHPEMEKIISSWNRETLLTELTERGDDFSPEARAFLHAELLRRGVTEEEIQLAAERYRSHLSERQFTHDELVVIRTFDAMPIAEAARDELEDAGIPCLLHGSDRLLFGPGLLRVGPDPITIKVAEHDATRARQLLESFALPLSEDEVGEDGEEE